MRVALSWLCLAATATTCGCQPAPPPASDPPATNVVTNRIPVPPEVIANIGITFETAQRGKLGRWIRVPGRLEVPEDRRWVLRAPAGGRVRPRVRVGQTVQKGEVLLELESPALKASEKALLSAASAVRNAEAEASAANERFAEAESVVSDAARFEELCEQRRTRIRSIIDESPESTSGALSSQTLLEADRALVAARERSLDAAVTRDDLRRRARQLELDILRARLELDEELAALGLLTGMSRESLLADEGGRPAWQGLTTLPIRAPGAGLVMAVRVAEGQRVAAQSPVVTVFDPSTLAFRGTLPESDLGSLRPNAPVRLEVAGTSDDPIETQLWDSPPTLDTTSRTLEVSAWVANPSTRWPHGISATAQVQVAVSESDEVLIPEACVVFDGLEAVAFVRDAADPGIVVRTAVELGQRGAGLVEVLAGVLDGDEVVRDGVYPLQQTGLGKGPEGGHFHADGTWHEGH